MKKNPGEIEELFLQFDLSRIFFAEEEEEEASIVVSLRDITERKQAEETLSDSEEKYRTMIEQSNDMIWTLDKESNFTFFNPRAEKITGYFLKDWKGKSFAPLIVKEDLPLVTEIFLSTLKGQARNYEVRIISKEGTILLLSVNTVPITKAGEIIGTVSFGRDITERKQAEEELQKRLRELGIYYDATIGRESRIIELKHQVNELLVQLGKKKKYNV